MARSSYVNGRYVPHREAVVHIEDRGYQFADGVYEVVTIVAGRLVDEEPHLDRLERSLGEMQIEWPVSRRVLALIVRQLIRRNRLENGILYMQITRGVAPRDHKFPIDTEPSLVMTTKRIDFSAEQKYSNGVGVISIPDQRWSRCDIKTVSLLANCMGKQQAAEAGAYEAWQIDKDGFVTEGTSSNSWIVTPDGHMLTRPPTNAILNGVTRLSLLRIAEEEGMVMEERAFTLEEAYQAQEAFVTSATSFVTPVVTLDGRPVGDGTPGTLTRRLVAWYTDYIAGLRATA
jgi:D-alanine transaminase